MSRHEPRPAANPVPDDPLVPDDDFVRATGTLAHDINNLLTAVIGYATLLARGLEDRDPRRADANEIVQAAQQAGALAHEILVMTGRRPRSEQTFDDAMTRPNETVAEESPRVLVVEDDRAVRYLVRTILTRAGYDVCEAASVEAAGAWLERHAASLRLLISDVVMPDGNGAALYKQATTANADLRVLYMSGYSEDEIAHEQLLGPGAPFIQKPFSGDELARKVRDVLRAQSSRDQQLR
jgi:CheY-like chemotaxis protein